MEGIIKRNFPCLASDNNVKTLKSKKIEASIRLFVPSELSKHALCEAKGHRPSSSILIIL